MCDDDDDCEGMRERGGRGIEGGEGEMFVKVYVSAAGGGEGE